MYLSLHLCLHLYLHLCLHLCLHLYLHLCLHLRLHLDLHLCLHLYLWVRPVACSAAQGGAGARPVRGGTRGVGGEGPASDGTHGGRGTRGQGARGEGTRERERRKGKGARPPNHAPASLCLPGLALCRLLPPALAFLALLFGTQALP